MLQKVYIVLGAENSDKGVLGAISKNRLDVCSGLYKEGDLVLCTGGWGAQFNTTKIAHAFYAQEYLLKRGILKPDLLKPTLSSNTVDDAVKLKEVLENLKKCDLILITSDFHMERVKLIFNEILKKYTISFVEAKNTLNVDELQMYENHEKKAIQGILESGLYY